MTPVRKLIFHVCGYHQAVVSLITELIIIKDVSMIAQEQTLCLGM